MTKILKGKPVPHVVIVDTNILWLEDKAPAVNPEFDKFWTEHQTLVELELKIPEVVRGELLFQQVSSCTKILDKVTKHISEISLITAADHKQKITHERIRRQVTDKMDRWIKSKGAQVLPIPIANIDWMTLCNAAIWRLAPFVPDPKMPDAEKGFRDALISETVVEFAKSESRNVNIAFVCNDFVLRTVTAERLKSDPRCACYESLLDFSSYMKLTQQMLTNDFIKKIVRRAAVKFYKADDPTCLLRKELVISKLESERSHFELPYSALPLTFLNTSPVSTVINAADPYQLPTLYPQSLLPTWTPDTRGAWFVGVQEFQKTTGERTYHWKTTLTYIRKYTSTSSVADIGSGGIKTEERMLVVKFNVFWVANVKADARFHDVALEKTEFDTKDFRPPTDAERQRFKVDEATPKT